MANKRALKKNVNLICDELYIDFIAASLYGNTHDDKILANILLDYARSGGNMDDLTPDKVFGRRKQ